MRYAWVENNQIRDIAFGNPVELYHPDVAAFYTTQVPDDAANGDGWMDGQIVKPEPPSPAEPFAPTPPKVSPVEFKLLFTSAERLAIKAARATDPVVDDFFDIVDDPRLTEVDLALQSTQNGLAYLVNQSLLSEERKAIILTGVIS
jgi:hypothetical protein